MTDSITSYNFSSSAYPEEISILYSKYPHNKEATLHQEDYIILSAPRKDRLKVS
jgi:hypothetical protein